MEYELSEGVKTLTPDHIALLSECSKTAAYKATMEYELSEGVKTLVTPDHIALLSECRMTAAENRVQGFIQFQATADVHTQPRVVEQEIFAIRRVEPAHQSPTPFRLCTLKNVPEGYSRTNTGCTLQFYHDVLAEGQTGELQTEEYQTLSGQMSTLQGNAQASAYADSFDGRAPLLVESFDRNFHDHSMDQRLHTMDHRVVAVEKNVKKKGDIDGGLDRRDIKYWERRGLSSEGSLINSSGNLKLKLCEVTPNEVLYSYFLRGHGGFHIRHMEEAMSRRMSTLFEKIYECSIEFGVITMRFGRAFLAQELKGVKLNWAHYAMTEHIRISDRLAKTAKNTNMDPKFKDIDQDENEVRIQLALDAEDSAISATQQDSSNEQRGDQAAYPSWSGPGHCVMSSSVQNAMDCDLRDMRSELKKRLMQTHVVRETLNDFDSLVGHYFSHMAWTRLEQEEEEDLTWAQSMADHRCKLLNSKAYTVEGRIQVAKQCVEDAEKKLQNFLTSKPSNPTRHYASWRMWCLDLQQQCESLGFHKHELQEQEVVLRKIESEYQEGDAERKSLFQKLLLLRSGPSLESLAEDEEGFKRRRLGL